MEFTRITSVKDELFAKCRELYCISFPIEEQRSVEEHERVFNNHENFYFYAITSENKVIGLVSFWEFTGVLYGEHLAIDPALRGNYIGGTVVEFLKEKATQMRKPMVLEIEVPCDTITKRREGFYIRHGFVGNTIEHYQPPYHKGFEPLKMILMSYPGTIDEKLYKEYYSEYDAIMPKF